MLLPPSISPAAPWCLFYRATYQKRLTSAILHGCNEMGQEWRSGRLTDKDPIGGRFECGYDYVLLIPACRISGEHGR